MGRGVVVLVVAVIMVSQGRRDGEGCDGVSCRTGGSGGDSIG